MGKKDVLNEFMHAENLTTTELASILQRRTGVVSSMKTRGLSKNYATKIKELHPAFLRDIKKEGAHLCAQNASGSLRVSHTYGATSNIAPFTTSKDCRKKMYFHAAKIVSKKHICK